MLLFSAIPALNVATCGSAGIIRPLNLAYEFEWGLNCPCPVRQDSDNHPFSY